MALRAKASDEALVELFLDMQAAERGAGENTLAAYRNDLDDLTAYLRAQGVSVADANTDALRGFLSGLAERGFAASSLTRVCQSGYPRGMNSSRALSIDSSGLLRRAPAVSSAELSSRIARRCGPPKKLAGPPPPTIPTRIFRWLMVSTPGIVLSS